MPSQLLTKAELGELLGISLRTLSSWVREGMPTIATGGRGKLYDLEAVETWMLERHRGIKLRRDSGSGQSARKTRSQVDYLNFKTKREQYAAEMAELDYLQAVGLVIPAEDVQAAQFDSSRLIRDRVMAAIDRADGMLSAIPQAAPIRGAIRADLRRVLNELSAAFTLESADPPA